MKKEHRPTKVQKIACKCGELQVKVYPNSSMNIKEGLAIPPCKKCLAKLEEVAQAQRAKARKNAF